MKQIFLILCICGGFYLHATSVKIQNTSSKTGTHEEIPVRADVTNGKLTISMTSVVGMTVVVTAPEGIVYQNSITTENQKTISIDLQHYSTGTYNLYFYDALGNQYEGEFEILTAEAPGSI